MTQKVHGKTKQNKQLENAHKEKEMHRNSEWNAQRTA